MTFSIKEALLFGWHKTRLHSGLLFKILITLFALMVAQELVSVVLKQSVIGFLAVFALTVAQFVAGVGLVLVTLRIAQGRHASYENIVPPLQTLWQYAVAHLLAGLIILLGLILLIVPGIYFIIRFSMVRFLVLEGAGIKGSLKKSGELTEGIKWQLLGFLIVLCLVNLLGLLFFFVGLLVTIPVSMIAYAHVYQKLHTHHHTHKA